MVEDIAAAFKGQRFETLPPDPRVIDVARMRSLRERLTNRFYYRWREHEADAELVEALFNAKTDSKGTRWQLSIGIKWIDEHGSSSRVWVDPNEQLANVERGPQFRKSYYITVSSAAVVRYISDFDLAHRLIWAVLPKRHLTLEFSGGPYRVKLGQAEQEGPWIEANTAPLALVAALLEHLERNPQDAAHWRSALTG